MHIAPRLARRTPFFYGWAILGAAGSAYFVRNAAASLTLAVFMFPVADELGWSRTLIAGAASVGGLAASVASPIAGWLVDRYGARLVLGASVLILGLSTVSLAWATVPIAFYIAYGTGRVMFSSPLQIGATVVVSRWFIRRRGRAQGLLFAAHAVGMTAFPLIAAAIIHAYGWRPAWVVLGLLVWSVALVPALDDDSFAFELDLVAPLNEAASSPQPVWDQAINDCLKAYRRDFGPLVKAWRSSNRRRENERHMGKSMWAIDYLTNTRRFLMSWSLLGRTSGDIPCRRRERGSFENGACP